MKNTTVSTSVTPSVNHAKGLARLVDEFLMLVSETSAYQGESSVRAVMAEAQHTLMEIRRRLRMTSGRFVVAVVGLTNVGKSTLLNALLGDDVAPRRNGPCTAVPIEFVFGAEMRVTAFFQQSLRRPRWDCACVGDIHQRLESLANDSSSEASRSIERVTVEFPQPRRIAGTEVQKANPGPRGSRDDRICAAFARPVYRSRRRLRC